MKVSMEVRVVKATDRFVQEPDMEISTNITMETENNNSMENMDNMESGDLEEEIWSDISGFVEAVEK